MEPTWCFRPEVFLFAQFSYSYVEEVLDPGVEMGYFSIPPYRRVWGLTKFCVMTVVRKTKSGVVISFQIL